MTARKCGCVYATSKNTDSVRTGHEMGGYLKFRCAAHQLVGMLAPVTTSEPPDIVKKLLDSRERFIFQGGSDFAKKLLKELSEWKP